MWWGLLPRGEANEGDQAAVIKLPRRDEDFPSCGWDFPGSRRTATFMLKEALSTHANKREFEKALKWMMNMKFLTTILFKKKNLDIHPLIWIANGTAGVVLWLCLFNLCSAVLCLLWTQSQLWVTHWTWSCKEFFPQLICILVVTRNSMMDKNVGCCQLWGESSQNWREVWS